MLSTVLTEQNQKHTKSQSPNETVNSLGGWADLNGGDVAVQAVEQDRELFFSGSG